MITANGKTIIKRFHARQVGQIASALAFGVGATAPTVNDTRLVYEVVRVPILSASVDPATDRIVFRAALPTGSIKTVYEVGLWSSSGGPEASKSLGLIGSSTTVWTNGTLSNAQSRIGTNAVQIDTTANTTTNAEATSFFEDVSGFSGVDSMVLGYYATTNIANVRVRLGTDASNYYEFVLPATAVGAYNIARVALSSATTVGAPDWSAITYVAVRPTGTAGGTGSIHLDGIRFEQNAITDSDLLVARSVLATPQTPDPDITTDVEYSLKVTTS